MSTTHAVPVAELRATLGDAVARVSYTGERTIITRHGKPAAALVSAADLARLEALEMAEDVADYDRAMAEDDGEHITLAEYRASEGD